MLTSKSLLSLMLFAVLVIGMNDCSIYNPCGNNGYCKDNTHGHWECKCKFWWNGSICNKLTNSGIQVIILGCLLAILISIYYGLIVVNKFSKKKYESHPQINHTIQFCRKTVQIDTNTRNTSQFYFICLSMPVFVVSGIILKWSILQSIHNEIVEKFHRNSSLFYESHAVCRAFNFHKFNMILLPLSCLLIFLFVIERRRVSRIPSRCLGYFASPVPLDFFTRFDRKLAAITFSIYANELLEIVNQTLIGDSSTENGVVVTYLQRILQVLAMGFRYYPILVAVYNNSRFSLALGTLYIWLAFPITIVQQSLCQPKYYSTAESINRSNTEILLNYYGTGSFLVIIELVTAIPGYFCFAYVSVKLPMLLFNRVRHRYVQMSNGKILTREEQALIDVLRTNSVEMVYLRSLTNKDKQRLSNDISFAQIISDKIYKWRDDFEFPTRVLCVYASTFLLLYFTLIQTCVQILPYMNFFERSLQELIDFLFGIQSCPSFSLPHFVRPFFLAVSISAMIIFIQLFASLASIRRNLLQTFRGDTSEIPRRQSSSNVDHATGNFHFAGYLIGYVIWGLILIVVFAFIFFMCIDLLITLSGFYIIEAILKQLIPILLLYYFKEFLNKTIARFVFLQHNGDILAVNNRRVLMIFLYFNFFLDAFLGLVSSFLRLLKSLIGTIIYMSRLDYSPLGRKLETWDDGFTSYCGFIHIECAHRHPLLLIFAGYLLNKVKNNNDDTVSQKTIDINAKDTIIMVDETTKNTRKGNRRGHWVRKWQVAAFLTRNPSIVFFRKCHQKAFDSYIVQITPKLINQDKNVNIMRRRMSI